MGATRQLPVVYLEAGHKAFELMRNMTDSTRYECADAGPVEKVTSRRKADDLGPARLTHRHCFLKV